MNTFRMKFDILRRRFELATGQKFRSKSADGLAYTRGAGDLKSGSESSGSGWIEGYAAVWDVVDLHREIMVKGCFAENLREVVDSGQIKLMSRHYAFGGDANECVGTVTQAREDDYGLWIHAEFASTPSAQDLRTLVLEKHVRSLSVGYIPSEQEERKVGDAFCVTHLKAEFCEVTITCKPVNVQASITAVKARRK